RRRLGDVAGLTQFGVNYTRLPPGSWSSQRHWHAQEDELIYVLEGELVLVCDDGEELLRAGDCAAFKAGTRIGHHLQNRSASDALLLEIGTRSARPEGEFVDYPAIDMQLSGGRFIHRDGTAYDQSPPR
ncbi:MAG TPA: cupin domain-containing protein, partial [Steroidobacteraceae bacterium]|nr:cupin domain-containing protein [Steroidobacteraceae bacterium]